MLEKCGQILCIGLWLKLQQFKPTGRSDFNYEARPAHDSRQAIEFMLLWYSRFYPIIKFDIDFRVAKGYTKGKGVYICMK